MAMTPSPSELQAAILGPKGLQGYRLSNVRGVDLTWDTPDIAATSFSTRAQNTPKRIRAHAGFHGQPRAK